MVLFTTHNHSNITRVHSRALGWCTLLTCCHRLDPPIIYTFKTSIQLYICLNCKCFGMCHGKIRAKPCMSLRNAGVMLWSSLFTPPSLSAWFPIMEWLELWNKVVILIFSAPFLVPAKWIREKVLKHGRAGARFIFIMHGLDIRMCFVFWRAQGWSSIPWGHSLLQVTKLVHNTAWFGLHAKLHLNFPTQ